MLKRSCVGAVVVLMLAGLVRGQATQSHLMEPGEAEGKATTRAVTLPATWAHPASEIRGVWVTRNDMEMAKGETPEQRRERLVGQVAKLAEAHFNLLMIDTWFQGFVPYEGSKLVPAYGPFKGEDLPKLLIDEAHKHGMHAQLWLSYGFYAFFTPDAAKVQTKGALLDAHPELAGMDNEGKYFLHRSFGDYYSLCPSNPASHELLGKLMEEQLERYPEADGIHLDRIRYPEETYCFCNYCKAHFKADTGLELKNYAKGTAEARTLLNWRREQTAKAVSHFHDLVKGRNPKLALTAYVVGPFEMDGKAQGWDLWAQRGLLDAVGVSMYGADIRPAAERAIALLGPARDKLVCSLAADKTTEIYLSNIAVAREYTKLGQFTWFLGELKDDWEGLEKGPYAEPAKDPLKAE